MSSSAAASGSTACPPREDADCHASLDLLSNPVAVVDRTGSVVFLNQAAELQFDVSARLACGHAFAQLFVDGSAIEQVIADASKAKYGRQRLRLVLTRPLHEPIQLLLDASALEDGRDHLLFEFTVLDEFVRLDRGEQLFDAVQANKELVRNLAHEIKNPLGGLRGAAQLLEAELSSPVLREYTQVIIKEADRLQRLVDRLLAPHRQPRVVSEVNIHEVCERVRTVVLAEFPKGLTIVRDYDASLPDLRGDRGQMIQVLLNLVRNAAQVMAGVGTITLRTRIARQVTIGRRRWKLALELHVIDDGPGVPQEIRDRVFFPLVSAREGGTGLGLTLAQTFVQQHGGLIECESRPGHTDFRILLPLQ